MIRKAINADIETLAQLANELWPDHSREALAQEFLDILDDEHAVCFLKEVDGIPVGFVHCQLRTDYVEGTASSPVAYLEVIFVREGFRRRGIGRALILVSEEWARSAGCFEFASDCELTNVDSLAFHLALGFNEANRVICFQKNL